MRRTWSAHSDRKDSTWAEPDAIALIGDSGMAFDPANYRKKITLAGGDFSVEYRVRALPPTGRFEPAILQSPDIIQAIAESFLAAGATVLVTSTDRANAASAVDLGLDEATTMEQVRTINRNAAVLCRQAVAEVAPSSALVFGGIGPVEQLLSLEEIDFSVLSAAYHAQAHALAEGGADAILCRSFTELEALCLAVTAAKQATGLPVIGSMAFDCGPQHTETSMGVTVPQACAALAGADGVGCDHAEYPDRLPEIVSLVRDSSDLPIWVEINAGRAELIDGQARFPETPQVFGERLEAVARAGASFIGGGYGATASHIAALEKARERYLAKRGLSG